jgi:hypothetical protein
VTTAPGRSTLGGHVSAVTWAFLETMHGDTSRHRHTV